MPANRGLWRSNGPAPTDVAIVRRPNSFQANQTVNGSFFVTGSVGIGTTAPLNTLDVRGLITGPGNKTQMDLSTGGSAQGQVVFHFADTSFFFAGIYSIFATNDQFFQVAPTSAGYAVFEGATGGAPFAIGTNNVSPILFYIGRGFIGGAATAAEVARFDTDGSFKLRVKDGSNIVDTVAQFLPSFVSNIHASFTTRLIIKMQDANAAREVMRLEANGSSVAFGIFGAAAVTQQANASQAAINAITDANAKAVCQAFYNLLKNYGFAPPTA